MEKKEKSDKPKFADELLERYKTTIDKTWIEADNIFEEMKIRIKDPMDFIYLGKKLSSLKYEFHNVVNVAAVRAIMQECYCDWDDAYSTWNNEKIKRIALEKRLNQTRAIDLFSAAEDLGKDIWIFYIWKVFLDKGEILLATHNFDKYIRRLNSLESYLVVVNALMKKKLYKKVADPYIDKALYRYWISNSISILLSKYQSDINNTLLYRPIKALENS